MDGDIEKPGAEKVEDDDDWGESTPVKPAAPVEKVQENGLLGVTSDAPENPAPVAAKEPSSAAPPVPESKAPESSSPVTPAVDPTPVGAKPDA